MEIVSDGFYSLAQIVNGQNINLYCLNESFGWVRSQACLTGLVDCLFANKIQSTSIKKLLRTCNTSNCHKFNFHAYCLHMHCAHAHQKYIALKPNNNKLLSVNFNFRLFFTFLLIFQCRFINFFIHKLTFLKRKREKERELQMIMKTGKYLNFV